MDSACPNDSLDSTEIETMNLSFTDEQRMFRHSLRQFFEKESPTAKVREWEKTELGYAPDLYKKLGSLGYLGFFLPEAYGGLDRGFMDLVILYEEIGRALFPSPHCVSNVQAGLAILRFGTKQQKRELLPSLAKGEKVITVAWREAEEGSSGHSKTKTILQSGCFTFGGTKLFVPYVLGADLILTAVMSDPVGSKAPGAVTWFFVDAQDPRIRFEPIPVIGQEKLFSVSYDEVCVPFSQVLGEKGQGKPIQDAMDDWGKLAAAAEMVGGAQKAHEMAVCYAKERIQFEQPIGRFQAIQHLLAYSAVEIDGARLLTYKAAWAMEKGIDDARRLIAMAKFWASFAYYSATKKAHQVMGGFGFMEETDLQLYYRKAKGLEINCGTSQDQLDIIADCLEHGHFGDGLPWRGKGDGSWTN